MTTGTLPAAERNEGGPVRTDLAPLTRRFPALGDPMAAHWQSGTLGDARAPGPTSYWIDAIVQVRPDTATALRERAAAQPCPTPEVAEALAGRVPEGQWVGGEGLDRAFASGGFAGRAYVNSDTDTVVLVVQGGN